MCFHRPCYTHTCMYILWILYISESNLSWRLITRGATVSWKNKLNDNKAITKGYFSLGVQGSYCSSNEELFPLVGNYLIPELDSFFTDSPNFAKDKRRIYFICLWTGFHQRRIAEACIRSHSRANLLESQRYRRDTLLGVKFQVEFAHCCNYLILINSFIYVYWNWQGNKIGRLHVISIFFQI